MKILFVIRFPRFIEVLSNLTWNGTRIVDIEQKHLENIIMYLTRKIAELKECGFSQEFHKYNGYTYSEWLAIMKKRHTIMLEEQKIAEAKAEITRKYKEQMAAEKAALDAQFNAKYGDEPFAKQNNNSSNNSSGSSHYNPFGGDINGHMMPCGWYDVGGDY